MGEALSSSEQLVQIEGQLRSRKSFEAALTALSEFVSSRNRFILIQQHELALLQITKRILVLLRSRYSSVVFWNAAVEAFQTLQATLGERKSKLSEHVADSLLECKRYLQSSSEPVQSQTNSVFEGQLTGLEEHEAQAPSRTYEQIIAELFTDRLRAGQSEGAEELQDTAAAANTETLQELERQQIVALQDAGLLGDEGHAKPPPASRRAVKRLKQIVLTQAILASLREADAETLCSICREEFSVGETMQVMPCSSHHSFHTPCLGPWLKENNSCPICRFELETDDIKYETEKVQRHQDAIERKGAANAQSHNDFLYI